ncbi:DUF3558 family protein [Corynebacterium sp. MSK072]|uniref:DUF3558 family protein n=1 Tax=Corynebacterium rhinophilum TaxID=3050197 RepID=UPI00254E782D|nr:DUF3558 family protein [Corynebacterium sp. MSK072]MDK8829865.1 DUF3558 family protein [Corynebacterium sp. MSK072]
MKRQATVAALVVSSVALTGCAAEVGSRSASEDTAMTVEADGTSSVDGVGDANGNQGDDVEDNAGDSEHSKDEDTSAGAGLRGQTGATADGDSGVLPPPGEFDPADPDFELFDPCTEIPQDRLEAAGIGLPVGDQERKSGYAFCTFKAGSNQRNSGVIGFTSTLTSASNNEEKNREGDSSLGIVIESSDFKGIFCTVELLTNRGYLQVSHSGTDLSDSYQKKCSQAREILKKLQ